VARSAGNWINRLSIGMRRSKTQSPAQYIKVRMAQLLDESNKCHDPHDAQWYNRCAEELHWVLKMMEKDNGTGRSKS